MEETSMLETVERYIRGEMLPEERVFFEQLRKSNPTVDQMVVEHTIFLSQLSGYGEQKQFKSQLHETHAELVRLGEIKEVPPARVIVLWKKYKRVVFVAAAIAGITALGISGLVSYVSPKVPTEEQRLLGRRIDHTERVIYELEKKVNQPESATGPVINFNTGGTGFLVDGKGYIVTNAHLVAHATRVDVQNSQKQEFKTRIIYVDPINDLAILKIADSTFRPVTTLPYSISRSGTRLGEELFTFGYPRDEIVYSKGYMSARTGFKGDSATYQITVAANPGNSGTPVLNKDGEVVGVVKSNQSDAQGFVFAIPSKNIFMAIDSMRVDSSVLKNDSLFSRVHLPVVSSLRGMERTQQLARIEPYIFIVKSN